MANEFNEKELQWNIHTKGIWVSKKVAFLERIKKMNFRDKNLPVPDHVALDVMHYISEATKKKGIDPEAIVEFAYDDSKATDKLYGIRCAYADCYATIYLHSNTRVVSVIAVFKIPKLQIISKNGVSNVSRGTSEAE